MEALLWSRLPKHLLEGEVLTRLPWHEVFRLRSISKNWNLVLRCKEFRQRWKKDSSDIPLCFTSCPFQGNSFYNPATDSWNNAATDYESSVIAVYEKCLIECTGILNITFSVVGAAEGLLLLQVFNADVQSARQDNVIVLVNPLDPHTMRKVILLPILRRSATSQVIGMAWNAASSSHRILAVHHLGTMMPPFREGPERQSGFNIHKMWTFYCYDVKTFIWERIARWPKEKFRSFESPSMAKDPTHGGPISCLGRRSVPSAHDPDPVLNYYYVYDNGVSHGQTWIAREHGDPFPYAMDFANLFHRSGNRHSHRGSAVMVGGVLGNLESTSDAITLKSIHVWECPLEEGNGDPAVANSVPPPSEWVEVGAMPEEMLFELHDRVPSRKFRAAGEGRFICVANSTNDAVMHDMQTNSWWELPPYPGDYEISFDDCSDAYIRHWNNPYLYLCDPRLDIVLD